MPQRGFANDAINQLAAQDINNDVDAEDRMDAAVETHTKIPDPRRDELDRQVLLMVADVLQHVADALQKPPEDFIDGT